MDSMMQDILDSVPAGTSKRFNCPSCGGVASLSVRNENGNVKYICFKNTCGIRGINQTHIPAELVKSRLNTDSSITRGCSQPFVVPDHFVMGIGNAECMEMLRKWHCLEAYGTGAYKCAYDPKQNRLVFFITDSQGELVGAVGRKLDKYGAKVLNYDNSGTYPFICGDTDTVVLVEDCFSAIAVTRNPEYTGMALLGTVLKDEYIPFIQKYQKVIVALDADAKNKAISIERRLTYYHHHVKVWFLDKDIKLMKTVP